jgi:hypothetical protein
MVSASSDLPLRRAKRPRRVAVQLLGLITLGLTLLTTMTLPAQAAPTMASPTFQLVRSVPTGTAIFSPAAGDLWMSTGTSQAPGLQHYVNGTWTAVPVTSVLLGFSATASNDVWAIGNADGGLWHYDGTTWTSVAAPPSPPNENISGAMAVVDVSGPGAYAAFNYLANGADQALFAYCDGYTWTLLDLPPLAAGGDQIQSVYQMVVSGDPRRRGQRCGRLSPRRRCLPREMAGAMTDL